MWLGLLTLLVGVLVLSWALVLLARWGMRWGSTPQERAMPMGGDAWLEGGPDLRVRMTRAIGLKAPAETVWPWLAQLGRGAGWYSIDRLDNGGRTSARHLVSWIPPPRLGDATAIGYLRGLDPGCELAWWVSGVRILGARVRSVMTYRVVPQGDGSRVVVRMSWDATGLAARAVFAAFIVIDSIMARRQLLNLRKRVERFGARAADPQATETGARDQYQLYQVIYASGEQAGVPGKEQAEMWRRAAEADGLLAGRAQGAGRRTR